MEVTKSKLPQDAFTVCFEAEGAFVDCYHIDVHKTVYLEEFIQAFYSTPIFKIERNILSILTKNKVKDIEVKDLSLGNTKYFSIWCVEERNPDQILLRDCKWNTRSWLMVNHLNQEGGVLTRLYFGSVVMPRRTLANGKKSFGFFFHLLGGFHRVYSKLLLKSAFSKISSN